MIEISQEEAVTRFAQLMQPYLPTTANLRSLIDAFAAFYRDVRITNADVDRDDDMLLLEWGTANPHVISGFTDLRAPVSKETGWDNRKFQWIGLNRQIFTPEDDETDFDGEAIALCAYVFFEEDSSREHSSNLWISRPSELNDKLHQFLQKERLRTLMDSKPSLVNAFVSYVG